MLKKIFFCCVVMFIGNYILASSKENASQLWKEIYDQIVNDDYQKFEESITQAEESEGDNFSVFINKRQKDENLKSTSLLQAAIENDATDFVRLLIKKGATAGKYNLFNALQFSDIDIVQILYDKLQDQITKDDYEALIRSALNIMNDNSTKMDAKLTFLQNKKITIDNEILKNIIKENFIKALNNAELADTISPLARLAKKYNVSIKDISDILSKNSNIYDYKIMDLTKRKIKKIFADHLADLAQALKRV